MSPHMNPQFCWSPKPFLTDITRVFQGRLISSMLPQVILQLIFCRKRLSAIITHEGAFVGVLRPDVAIKVNFLGKRASAIGTHIRAFAPVDFLVGFQGAPVGKTLLAGITSVGLGPRMGAFVNMHLGESSESSRANFARVGLLPGVGPDVDCEFVAFVET